MRVSAARRILRNAGRAVPVRNIGGKTIAGPRDGCHVAGPDSAIEYAEACTGTR